MALTLRVGSPRHRRSLVLLSMLGCTEPRTGPPPPSESYHVTTDKNTWQTDLANMRVKFPNYDRDHSEISIYIGSKLTCDGGTYDHERFGQSCVASTSGRNAYTINIELAQVEVDRLLELGGAFTFNADTHIQYELDPDEDNLTYAATAYACDADDCWVDDVGRDCISDWTTTYLSRLDLTPNDDLTWDVYFEGWLTPEAAAAPLGEPYVHGRVKLKDCTDCDVQEEGEAWQEHHTCDE